MSEQWWLKDFRFPFSGWQFFRKIRICWSFFGVCEAESWNSRRFPGGRSNASLYVTGRRHWKTTSTVWTCWLFQYLEILYVFFSKKNHQHQMLIYQSSKESWYGKAWWNKSTNWESKRVDLENHPLLSAERLLELAEGTLRILWMQQFSFCLDVVKRDVRDVWSPGGSALLLLVDWCFEDPPYL